jgi:hypothetical protein
MRKRAIFAQSVIGAGFAPGLERVEVQQCSLVRKRLQGDFLILVVGDW